MAGRFNLLAILVILTISMVCQVAMAHEKKYETGHPLHYKKNPITYDDGKSKPPPRSKKVALAVEGVVLCQHCSYAGTPSLKDAKPLAGAKVTLACKGLRYKSFLYETTTTDAHGYFLFHVPKFDFVKYDPLKGCNVVLVSSSDKYCNIPTDINHGKVGATLKKVKNFADEDLYSVGPLAFAPPPCQKYQPSNLPIYKSPSPTTYMYQPPPQRAPPPLKY